RRGPAGKAARRARLRRRQRPLPGHRAARQSPDRARQAVRHDGLSEPDARDRRRAGHDGAHLPPDWPLPARASATAAMSFPIEPPIEPMLAKLADELPPPGPFLYEPKWDGFRSIVFRAGSELLLQSGDLRPLDRYFPELHDALLAGLPDRCVVDGEIVIATPRGLDFDALQLRLHPAASRAAKLAKETP